MKENIKSHLRKEFWRRRVAPDAIDRHIPARAEYYTAPHLIDPDVDLFTQEDFMRENAPAAHDINSRYMSLRPVYDSREKTDADGNKIIGPDGLPETEWYITDFDRLETVRYALQYRINISKAAYMAGNGFWVNHEDHDHTTGEILNSHKDSAGLDIAWLELVRSLYLTGDGAIYLYILNGRLHYQVFSYLKGDILFPDIDQNRNPVLYRLYTLRGRRAVDVYASSFIDTWIEDTDPQSDRNSSWWQRVGGWFAPGANPRTAVRSADGWLRIAHTKTQTPDGYNQCTYWRIDDIPSGICQQEITSLEKAASFVADGVKSVSQAILFIKAPNIENLPATDSTGKVIGVRGAVDQLAHADAKFLTPPDLSNIATVDIANKLDSILKSSLTVNITPEIFRSGADSSAAMKLLFTDAIIWCKNNFPDLYPRLCDLVEVFKQLVAIIEIHGQGPQIAAMRTSCGCDFWIPQNDSEVLQREIDMVIARIKSRKAAMADAGNSHIEDYDQIRREWQEEQQLKSATLQNPKSDSQNFDNRLPGQSIPK